MELEDIQQQKRLTDQMLSAYSVLRDRYARRAKIFNLILLAAAVILNALTFMPQNAMTLFFLDSHLADLTIKISAVTIFFLALVEMRVDWNGQARLYGNAAEQLATLKGLYSGVQSVIRAADQTKMSEISRAYHATMALLPRIPERSFLPLKSYHKRKVEISKRIDDWPGRPLWLLKLDIILEGLMKKK